MTRMKRSIVKSSSSRKPKSAPARQKVIEVIKEVKTPAPKGPGRVNQIARGIGTTVGNVFGGQHLGSALGDASSWLARIMGFGKYTIRSNSLMGASNSGQVPSFSTNGDKVIIKHRELISDLSSSINFTSTTYYNNPANPLVFKWLAPIAAQFEEYQFLGLIYEYKEDSATALNSTNTALGYVNIASDYNCLNAPFTDKVHMENTEFNTVSPPCESQIHPIECAPSSNLFNKLLTTSITNPSQLPTGADARLYFPCSTQVATVGMQAVADIGEVWVSYQVQLSKPVLTTTANAQANMMGWRFKAYQSAITSFQQDVSGFTGAPSLVFGGSDNTNLSMQLVFGPNYGYFGQMLTMTIVSDCGATYNVAATAMASQTIYSPNVTLGGFTAADGTAVSEVQHAYVIGGGTTTTQTSQYLSTHRFVPQYNAASATSYQVPLQQWTSTTGSYFCTLQVNRALYQGGPYNTTHNTTQGWKEEYSKPLEPDTPLFSYQPSSKDEILEQVWPRKNIPGDELPLKIPVLERTRDITDYDDGMDATEFREKMSSLEGMIEKLLLIQDKSHSYPTN